MLNSSPDSTGRTRIVACWTRRWRWYGRRPIPWVSHSLMTTNWNIGGFFFVPSRTILGLIGWATTRALPADPIIIVPFNDSSFKMNFYPLIDSRLPAFASRSYTMKIALLTILKKWGNSQLWTLLTGEDGSLFSGALYDHYSPPSGFCFDVLCEDSPIIDNPRLADYNVPTKVTVPIALNLMELNFGQFPIMPHCVLA